MTVVCPIFAPSHYGLARFLCLKFSFTPNLLTSTKPFAISTTMEEDAAGKSFASKRSQGRAKNLFGRWTVMRSSYVVDRIKALAHIRRGKSLSARPSSFQLAKKFLQWKRTLGDRLNESRTRIRARFISFEGFYLREVDLCFIFHLAIELFSARSYYRLDRC